MSEVRYSINGQYFKDFGIYVSDSNGIADTLKRKKVNTYDWAEYHGLQVDLSKPKYEARDIELKCFIVGENWETLFANFNKMIRDEFAKEGTQRLLIEPLGFKALPYEVYLQDEVKVDKTFRNGQMVATFSLKMIEPNPIKKVLYFTGDKLDLAFNSPTETEIFYGNGLKEIATGNVSLSGKTLANRVVSGYAFGGRNYAVNSYYNKDQGRSNVYVFETWFEVKEEGDYTISFKGFVTEAKNIFIVSKEDGTPIYSGEIWSSSIDKFTFNFHKGRYSIRINAENSVFHLDWISVNKGNVGANEWVQDEESKKYIILAGNIEDITGLTTNAKVLWERL